MDDQTPDKPESTDTLKPPEQSDFSSPKHIRHGHKLIYGYVLLLVLAAITGYGGYYYHKHHDPAKSDSSKSSSLVTKKVTNMPSQVAKTQYLAIPEWGVEIPLTNAIKDAYFAWSGSSNDEDGLPSTISLGLTSLNSSCGTVSISNQGFDSALGFIIRVLPTEKDPVSGKLYTELDPNGATIGDYYYGLSDVALTKTCSSKSTLSSVGAAFSSAIEHMVSTGPKWESYSSAINGYAYNFMYPSSWTAGNSQGDMGTEVTSSTFATDSATTTANPGAPINLFLQFSSESSTIDCAEAPCKVSAVVPLSNSHLSGAVLAVVNQTSNNGTKFTEYVVASGNTKVGDTSIVPVALPASSVYIFGQPEYNTNGHGVTEIEAASITNTATLQSNIYFKQMVSIINDIDAN